MPRFALDKPLPSTRVTRDLVRSLETYVAQRTSALAAKPTEEQDALRASRKTTIEDDLGTEQLGTIDEHAQLTFSDTTTQVSVEFRGSHKTSLERLAIEVRLAKEQSSSRTRISWDGPNAREVVVGIYDGIKRCVETSPARNSLFHPPALWQGAIGALTLGVFMAAVVAWRLVPAFVTGALFAIWLTLYLLWSVAPRFRPYTVFESDRANRHARAGDWLLKGLLGFLLFGIVLTLARDKFVEWLRGAG